MPSSSRRDIFLASPVQNPDPKIPLDVERSYIYIRPSIKCKKIRKPMKEKSGEHFWDSCWVDYR